MPVPGVPTISEGWRFPYPGSRRSPPKHFRCLRRSRLAGLDFERVSLLGFPYGAALRPSMILGLRAFLPLPIRYRRRRGNSVPVQFCYAIANCLHGFAVPLGICIAQFFRDISCEKTIHLVVVVQNFRLKSVRFELKACAYAGPSHLGQYNLNSQRETSDAYFVVVGTARDAAPYGRTPRRTARSIKKHLPPQAGFELATTGYYGTLASAGPRLSQGFSITLPAFDPPLQPQPEADSLNSQSADDLRPRSRQRETAVFFLQVAGRVVVESRLRASEQALLRDPRSASPASTQA